MEDSVNPKSTEADFQDPAWTRRWTLALMTVVVLWPLFSAVEFKPWVLFEPENLRASAAFIGSFWPLAFDAEFLELIIRSLWMTIAIATVGTFLAVLLAWPFALLSCRALSVSALSGRMALSSFALRQLIRWLLLVLRSIPEIVWALVFVRIVGLGPSAGVFAIALTYAGMLGKVYGEILESNAQHATQSLLRNGAGRMQSFLYGLLPGSASDLASYTIYRWECAIRSSVILGFVGAGGLGQQLDHSMKMFNGGEVGTILIIFMILVAVTERVSSWFRRLLA